MNESKKHGLRFRVVEMTPKLAQKYLSQNQSNRNLRRRKVAEYKRQMEKGYWHLTPQGIALSADGKLLNGQHRLQAVVEYGKPVQMVVTTGVTHGAQQYMDSAIPRRVADNLKMFDGEVSATRLVAAAKALQLFDTGLWEPVILDDARKMIKKYRDSVDWMNTQPSNQLPRSAYFFAPLIWLHHHGWGDEIELFADEMATMEGLTKGSPVIALHKALARLQKGGGWKRSIHISMMTFNALRFYMEEEPVESRQISMTSSGFDYFNTQIKTIPKRRSKGTCMWHKGCSFKVVPASGSQPATDLCWLHYNIKQKRNR